MSDLPGTGAIEYYLKGRALKQQREKALMDWQNQQEQLKINSQQLDFIKQKFGKEFDEQVKLNKSLIAQRDAEIQQTKFKTLEGLADAFQKKLIEVDPSDPFGGIKLTKQGAAADEAIRTELNKFIAMSAPKIEAEIATHRGKTAVDMTMANLKHQLDMAKQKEHEGFLSGEWEKNRASAERIAKLRRDALLNGTNEYLEDHLDQIKNGNKDRAAITALPAKERSVIEGEAARRGYIIPIPKDLERLTEGSGLGEYIDIAEQLNSHIASFPTVAEAFLDTQTGQLQDRLSARAKQFSTTIAGDKSILTDRERPIIEAGTVTPNPARWRALDPRAPTQALNIAENNERLQDLKDAYMKRVNQILHGASPDQRAAFIEKYGLRTYKTRQDILKEKQKNAVPGKAGGKFNTKDPNEVEVK